MLFTPKKYGRDWTQFLEISFCAGAVGFAISAVSALFGQFDDLADRAFAVVAFIAGAIIFGALGRDKWRETSRMAKDGHRQR
jgi:uncharacterized membrane protein